MPETGVTPPVIALPRVNISGFYSFSKSHSYPINFPVLPNPVWTSSAINNTSYF